MCSYPEDFMNEMDQELDKFYVSLIAQFMQVIDTAEQEIRQVEQARARLRSKYDQN